MKKLLITTLAFGVLASGSAIAADIPVKAPRIVATYDWSGIYFGTRSGGAWSDLQDSWTVTDHYFLAGTNINQRASGYLFGGHVGVQQQWGNMVLGLEAAWDGYGKGFLSRTSFNLAAVPVVCTFQVTGNGSPCGVEDRVKETWQVAARIGWTGWAKDRIMTYVMGGWASTRVQVREAHCCNPLSTIQGDPFAAPSTISSATKWHDGAVAGVGIEVAVTDTLILGIEYNHLFLNNGTHRDDNPLQVAAGTPSAPTFAQKDLKGDIDRFMGRFSYKFGWGGSSVRAAY